jgi:hypothetical protein
MGEQKILTEILPILKDILPIITLIIGFFLSQSTDLMKNWKRKRLVKKALINELSIIRKTLSDALQGGEQRISDDQYPLITETYDSTRVDLASFLKLDSLTVVQRTYQEIRKMNSEGGGHIVIPPSSHLFQFIDFNNIIALIDDSISQLK